MVVQVQTKYSDQRMERCLLNDIWLVGLGLNVTYSSF